MKVLFAILGAFIVFILSPFLIDPTKLTLRNGDFSDLVWPDYFFIKQEIIKNRQIPLWNPTVFSGIPEIINPQSPIIYPVNILTVILPTDLGIVILMGVHIFIAGLFLFRLGKLLKWSDLSSAVLAFGVSSSPFIWGKFSVGHLSQAFATLLFAPLVYFSASFLKKPSRSKFFLMSLFLSFQYLNHPTIFYYSLFFGIPTILYIGYFRKKLKNSLLGVACLFLTFVLISPVLITHLKAAQEITRAGLKTDDLAIPLWSMIRFLKGIFLPSSFYSDNETEIWLYPGLSLIVLGVLGLFRIGRKIRILFLVLLLIVILITLGSRTPVFGILNQIIPGFSYLRVSTRDWFVFIFIISLLAGYGIEKIKGNAKWIFGLVVFLDLMLFSATRLWFIPDNMQPYSNTDLSQLLTKDDYRYYCTTRCLSARETTPLGINTADGYHPIILKKYKDRLSAAGGLRDPKYTGNLPTYENFGAQPDAEELGKFAVKWVISPYHLADQNFVKAKEQNGYSLYENKKVLPRIRFKNNRQNLINLISGTPDTIKIKTRGQADKLVLADSYYPGWQVVVDGIKGKILLEDGWARAVELSSGEHLVEFKFKPFNYPF